MDKINIAIDGPAGAGKSTISKAVAKRLSFVYIDTGALYRAIGIFALRNGVQTDNAAEVVPLLPQISLSLNYIDNTQRVILNGEDVSDEIRTPPASMAASNVSAIPEVRAFLLSLQRDIAKANNCIMDGRDIGTVILPHAQIKIFLTASPEERARRRFEELKEKGFDVDYDKLLAEIKQRDYNDSTREIAPLKPAPDSILYDSTGNELDESIEGLYQIIRGKIDELI